MVMMKLPLVFFAFMFLAAPLSAIETGAGNKGLRLQDLSGKEADIASFAQSSKKPLLLFFWTSWCPYCMKEIRTINQRKQALGDSVELFAVNAGESKSLVERVARNYKLEMRVFADEYGQVTGAYGIVGVPAFVLFDQQGAVVFNDNFFPDAAISTLQKKR
jgi:thiol-disulfide isomerase/thioredoxin